MHRVIVVGSPRPDGRSACLADELFNACIEECPEDGVSIVSVASIEVGPCHGCDACRVATEAPDKLPEDDDNLAIADEVLASDALVHRCVIHDDMTEVRKHLDAADELIVVSPVYFASAPAQLKCLMDRLQPYYWSNVRTKGRRPCVLHVVGDGGDPHGFEPLIGSVRSAFAVAGFQLEMVLDWVGKMDEDGEIIAEAEEYPLPPVGGFANFTWEEAEEEAEAEAEGAFCAFASDGDDRTDASEADARAKGVFPAGAEERVSASALRADGPAFASRGEDCDESRAAGREAADVRAGAGRAKLVISDADGRQGGKGSHQGASQKSPKSQGRQRASKSGARQGGQAQGSRKSSSAGSRGGGSRGKGGQGKGKRRG